MASIASTNIRHQAQRISRFLVVQLIALIGWIIVQSIFTLSPIGHNISFPVIMVIEGIWWAATLVIMFLLFRQEYNRFVKAALDLEEADKRLRESTNNILSELRRKDDNDEEQGQGGLALG